MSLRISALIVVLSLVLLCSNSDVWAMDSWPMLAHDPGRSGATSTEIRPPFERKWYRLFPDEGLIAGIQPIIKDGKVFIGTMRGILHAIDDETGEDIWAFKTTGSILHTCAVAGDKVFFGNAEGRVYAVDIDDGKLAWFIQTGAAVWNSPVVCQGIVLIGSRDGKIYAIDAESGRITWAKQTGGPLLSSPAVDAKAARVYICCEDMCIYAFDLSDGKQAWRSKKLPGVSFRGYHPVVAPDGSVMITVTPMLSLDSFNPILLDMVKEIFGDFASWRHTKEENARLRQENFKRMKEPSTYEAQLDYIRKRLSEEPVYQTFFVLDNNTGKQKFIAPIVYAESMNGTGAPPVVTPDSKIIVKFQALLRSRYEHYSPFLNVGYLDTSTGHITPIMDQTRTYGWHDSLLLVHDEQCQLTVSGRVLVNTHQDNVNAMDMDTLIGYDELSKIQQLPWDWDTCEMPRLSHLLKSIPAGVPGTRQQPLNEQAKESVSLISDAQLDRFIWETPKVEFADGNNVSILREMLADSIKELISKDWRPLVFPPGKHPREAYRFFVEPTETLLTLAQSYRYLDNTLQQEVRQYVAKLSHSGGALYGPIGQNKYDPDVGEIRSLYDIPTERLFRVNDDITMQSIGRLYPLWLWAHVTGDWSRIQGDWKLLRELIDEVPNKMEEDCHNGYLAGSIAYCRIAWQ